MHLHGFAGVRAARAVCVGMRFGGCDAAARRAVEIGELCGRVLFLGVFEGLANPQLQKQPV